MVGHQAVLGGDAARLREFVADPRKGSRHNRGCAVDLTLFDLATGREVEMPTPYDDFTERGPPDYAGGPAEAAQRATCCATRWRPRASSSIRRVVALRLRGWREYPILDVPFEALPVPGTG